MKNQSNQVKERPIIFSGEMVKAILDRKKTMTRRVVKSNFINHYKHAHIIRQSTDKKREGKAYFYDKPVGGMVLSSQLISNPYGEVGDLLWVRETWQEIGLDYLLTYKATYPSDLYAKRPELENLPPLAGLKERGYLWKSPMFMPRWASRILLEITDIKVERFQDISETDAKKEGMPPSHPSIDKISMQHGFNSFSQSCFAQSWDSLYDENSPKRWANNQWVWVIEFKVIKSC